MYKEGRVGEFPGGPVVGTRCFHCWDPGSIPGQGTKILQAAWCGQKKTKTKRRKGITGITSYFALVDRLTISCVYDCQVLLKII